MNMKHRITAAAIVAFSIIAALSGCVRTSALDGILQRKEIVVGVKEDSPPFGFRDQGGDLWGFDIDLAKRIARQLGVKPRFVPVTAADRIPKLLSGDVDILVASMTITRARERVVDFSYPYFETYQALLVRADSTVKDYMDLAGKKVGVAKGSTAMATLKVAQPDAVVVPFDEYDDVFKALEAGHVDAMATDYILLAGLMQGQGEKYKIVGKAGWEPYGIAMRQDDSKLRGRINEALQELWDRGSYQRIHENWFGERGRFPVKGNFSITTYPKGE
jgi:polar amino acid transport system substrate-binding protein